MAKRKIEPVKIDDLNATIETKEITDSKSISAIKIKCRKLGINNEIFDDIFGDLKLSSNKTQKEEDKINIDLSKYFIALQSVANATNKEDEIIEDIKNLMKKYIGE